MDVIELEKKAKELSLKFNCEVQPIVFNKDGEDIVGYIKTPSRLVKARTMDSAATTGTISAAGTLFDAILIKEESDSRFSSEKSCDDDIYFGGALAAFGTIEILVNQFKKK
jgi:hypothetical protein